MSLSYPQNGGIDSRGQQRAESGKSSNTVLVRLHDKGFLHAKCWLFYSDCPGQQLLFDRFRPILASGWVSACWPSEPRGSEADLFRLYQRGIEKPPSRRQQAQRLARGR